MEKIELKIENDRIYAPLKKKWLIKTPEEYVRQKYICKLVNEYGYNLEQMDQEVTVSNSKRGKGRASADIIIWRTKEDKINCKSAFIVVECKAEKVKIKQEDYFQGSNYASMSGAEFFVTTNDKETRFFKVNKGVLPKELNEIIAIPKASEIKDTKKIEKYLNDIRKFEGDEFAKLLFKCHNIIRNNDRLSPEAAFDEIAKILFIKIMYERSAEHRGKIFSKEMFFKEEKKVKEAFKVTNTELKKPFYQYIFDQTKEKFKNDEIFDRNEDIKIKEVSFMEIVKLLEKYNLSDTSNDVKGIAFEEFLGKTFRGELGQFFTPRPIVDFMIEILDPAEGELICDPCAGSGGFLISAFEKIKEKIEEDVQIQKEILLSTLECLSDEEYGEKLNYINEELNKELQIDDEEIIFENDLKVKPRMNFLSRKSIYGTDANPRMARTSKMNMIMHGDGHSGVHHNDGLLNVNGIFENRFDVILTNPPFGTTISKNLKITKEDKYLNEEKIKEYIKEYGQEYEEALNKISENIDKPLLGLYELGKYTGKTEALFLERCLKLLKPGGRMGIVLPDGVLNNGKEMEKVREYCEGEAKIVLVVSIPQDVFIASGATVKSSLVFLKKFTLEEKEEYICLKKSIINEKEEKFKIIIENEKNKIENLKDELENVKIELKEQAKIKSNELEYLKLKNLEVELKENMKKLKKEINGILKNIEVQKENEIKKELKLRFNYIIPIADVADGGITTTGARTENIELKKLAKEFKEYREKNLIWTTSKKIYTYKFKNDSIIRVKRSGEK